MQGERIVDYLCIGNSYIQQNHNHPALQQITIELRHVAYHYRRPDFSLFQHCRKLDIWLLFYPPITAYIYFYIGLSSTSIAKALNFGCKHTKPILAWVEPAVFLMESSLSDSSPSPFFLQGFRGFTEAGQFAKEPLPNLFLIAAYKICGGYLTYMRHCESVTLVLASFLSIWCRGEIVYFKLAPC